MFLLLYVRTIDVCLQVVDFDRNMEPVHKLIHRSNTTVSLQSTQYRYNIGDIIDVNVTNTGANSTLLVGEMYLLFYLTIAGLWTLSSNCC